jgi:hypothetical protein
VTQATPLPTSCPEVVWRAGLDLHPIDVTDPDGTSWLETLVWPEHRERADRLRAALRVARRDPPQVSAGDLRRDLHDLVAQAPAGASVVVFHSAVLSYLPTRAAIAEFEQAVRDLDVTWIANESPAVLPHIAEGLDSERAVGRFLLAMDGRPLALTGPHGQSIDWLGT